MDEINILLLALVLAILIRRIFEPLCNQMDILWLPLLTFVIYWILLRLYSEQNPELKKLWSKVFLDTPHSFQETFVDEPKKKINNATIKREDVLAHIAQSTHNVFIETKREPTDDEIKKENEQQPQILSDEEQQQVSHVIHNLHNAKKIGNLTHKDYLNELQIVKEEQKEKEKKKDEKNTTAPTPIDYPTPPKSQSLVTMGPAESASVPVQPKQPQYLERSIDKKDLDHNHLSMAYDHNRLLNEETPLALFADQVINSLPKPMPQQIIVDVNVHDNKPVAPEARGTPIDQNFFIFGNLEHYNSMDHNKDVAPMVSATTFNGPLSADAQWATSRSSHQISAMNMQNKNKEMQKEREVMENHGIPIPYNTHVEIAKDIQDFYQRESHVGQDRKEPTPIKSQAFPHLDTKKISRNHRFPKHIYAEPSGGERILKTSEWEGQFKGILPKERESKMESKTPSCFPSGIILSSPWKEWKQIEQTQSE